MIQALTWENDRLFIIDQTLLPHQYRRIEINDHLEMADAIRRLAIRGAPAIGIAAAYGVMLGLRPFISASRNAFMQKSDEISDILFRTRPTAVNLGWALERMKTVTRQLPALAPPALWERLRDEARAIHREDIEMCERIAAFGMTLLQKGDHVITHCNAGGLATGGLGTALGIIIRAHQSGKQLFVYVDETRPLLQGARLTAWELMQEKVPFALCTDNMAAHLMATRRINAVIVGADRIAANGDTANKIGTRALAILARYQDIPFYIAAPSSTVDASIASGEEIIIETRSPQEVTHIGGTAIAPQNCPVENPAFDVTPAELIQAIVTEKEIYRFPYHFI